MDLTLINNPAAFDAAVSILVWCTAIASVPVGLGIALSVYIPR